jgi:hypothetical protein
MQIDLDRVSAELKRFPDSGERVFGGVAFAGGV